MKNTENKNCKSFSASMALFFPPRIVRDWFRFFIFLFSIPFYSRMNERSDGKNNFMWWQKDKETLKLTTLFCSLRSQIKRLYELRPHFTLAFYSFRIYAVFILVAAATTAAARHSLYKTLCTQSILCQSILNLFFSSGRTLTRYPRFWCIFFPRCSQFYVLMPCIHERDSSVNGREDLSSARMR